MKNTEEFKQKNVGVLPAGDPQTSNKFNAKSVGANCVRQKKHNGITLIALIITIIVMLILVGVTISVSLNGGLFGNARYAKSETLREMDREELYGMVILAYNTQQGVVDLNLLDEIIDSTDGWSVILNGKYKSANENVFIVETDGKIEDEKNSEGNGGGEPEKPATLPVEISILGDYMEITDEWGDLTLNDQGAAILVRQVEDGKTGEITTQTENGTYDFDYETNKGHLFMVYDGETETTNFELIPILDSDNNLVNKIIIVPISDDYIVTWSSNGNTGTEVIEGTYSCDGEILVFTTDGEVTNDKEGTFNYIICKPSDSSEKIIIYGDGVLTLKDDGSLVKKAKKGGSDKIYVKQN